MIKLSESSENARFFILDYKLYEWNNFNMFHLVAFEKLVPKGSSIVDDLIDKYGSSRDDIARGLYKDYNYLRCVLQRDILTVDSTPKNLQDRKNLKIINDYSKKNKVKQIILNDEYGKTIKKVMMENTFIDLESSILYAIQEHLARKDWSERLKERVK